MDTFMIVLLCVISFCAGSLFQLVLQAYIQE